MAGSAGFCWGVFAPAAFCAARFGAVATSPPLGCNGAGQAVFHPLPRINTLRRNTTPSLWGNAMGRRFYKRGAKKAWPLYATNRLCQHPTGMGRVAKAAAIFKRGNPPAPLPGPATRPVAPQPRRRVLQGHCRAVPPLAAGFLSFYPPGRASCHKQNRKCRCKSAKKVPAITSAGTFYFTITRTEGAYLYRVSNFLRYS